MGRNGGAILFCGAGFSADCLNFKPDDTIGTGAQLLNIFNAELRQDPQYKDLRNAADALSEEIGDHGMMSLLKKQFTISEITSDMAPLFRYPWQSIYTTNYDNALELAAKAAHVAVEVLNNTEAPDSTPEKLPVIHLHGHVQKWDIRNFRESCVLGAESYSKLTQVSKWLDRFRCDVDHAQIVVFVGFNANDFHLNQAIYDLTGLREKAFFINRPIARLDPDVTAVQRRLGTPFFIGRAELAEIIVDITSKVAPTEPRLIGFKKFTPPPHSETVPTQQQIEDLFIFGKVEPSQLSRDISNDVSDYHVRRSTIQETLDHIADGVRIVLFEGYPCDGKTMLVNDLAHRLSSTRPVYQMRQAYENVLEEVADIIDHDPQAVLIIENCFDLAVGRLASIARQFDGREGVLILTSRAVAVDASPFGLTSLVDLHSFRKIPLSRLDESEALALSNLADQIAGWRDFRTLDSASRLSFIMKTCQASLPNFLMKLLKSHYVTERYLEEFNKLSLDQTERTAIINALYIAHIGENVPVSFLSNAMGLDYGAIIDRLNANAGNGAFRLVRRNGDLLETVPSIGAQNILANLFKDREIVDAIAGLLKNLAPTYRDTFEQRIFNQIMRFSILIDVVSDRGEIDRFFEHNKQQQQIRRMPLFWLQWHMAKCADGKLSEAEKFLEQGYTEAADFERRNRKVFDKRQLDDRRAKFLMLRARESNRSGADLLRDFKGAIDLTEKIMRLDDPQRYPFETLDEIVQTFGLVSHKLSDEQKGIISQKIGIVFGYAKQRIGIIGPGFQRDKAQSALDNAAQQR